MVVTKHVGAGFLGEFAGHIEGDLIERYLDGQDKLGEGAFLVVGDTAVKLFR